MSEIKVKSTEFVKIWSSCQGTVSVSPKAYWHVTKHFIECPDNSYFYGSGKDILRVFSDTLASPDSSFKDKYKHNNMQNPAGIYLKTFSDDIGFSDKTQQPCRTARIVVCITSSGLKLITFYPQELY